MPIDWDIVKTKTLWQYEELTGKLIDVLGYDFVREHYNHSMDEAVIYAQRVSHGYLQDRKEQVYIDEISEDFRLLGSLGIKNYLDLAQQVETKEKCEAFLQETGFSFEALIQVLNYLFRMALPFKCPLKELVVITNQAELMAYEILKQHKIRSNLDMLEHFRTWENRSEWAKKTGIAEQLIITIVHRADISRLAYVRGKTVLHLCGGGYDTLDKIARANLKTMEADMAAYYQTIGKELSDFKAVIPLNWMVGGAKILPRVVEI